MSIHNLLLNFDQLMIIHRLEDYGYNNELKMLSLESLRRNKKMRFQIFHHSYLFCLLW